MKISKAELENALAAVKPGLASKELIEQGTSFAFIKGSVVTFNDEISVSHPVKGLELEGAIKAEELYQFLRRIKKDEIEFDISGSEVKLKAGRSRAGFTLQDEIRLPVNSIGKRGKWQNLPEDFCHYLNLAMGAAGTDMSAPLLTAVNVTQEGLMAASDNYKIMICEIGEEMPVDTFLIPAKSAAEVVKMKPMKIASGKGWIHFQNKEKTVLSCKIFEDEYPKPTKKMEVVGIELSFPRTIKDILDRVEIFSKREHILEEKVEIYIGGNRMKVKAENSTGWIEEEANIKYDDEPLQFNVTPYLLRDIITEAFEFTLGEKKLKFEGAGWSFVIATRG